MGRTGILLGLTLGVAALVACQAAHATVYSEFTFELPVQSNGLGGIAHFWVEDVGSGPTLKLQLTNISTSSDATKYVLGALLFDYNGPALTRDSAQSASGSGLYDNVEDGSGGYKWESFHYSGTGHAAPDIGPEWAYSDITGSTPLPHPILDVGVGALDYNWLEGTGHQFGPGNLGGPTGGTDFPLDGPDFALLNALAATTYSSKPDALPTQSAFVINTTGDVSNGASAIFTWSFTGSADDLNVARDIQGVWFQFGTGADDPGYFVPVPEPASLLLFGVGAAIAAAAVRRRKRS